MTPIELVIAECYTTGQADSQLRATEAAAELDRMRAVNAALVAALVGLTDWTARAFSTIDKAAWVDQDMLHHAIAVNTARVSLESARAAIARAEDVSF